MHHNQYNKQLTKAEKIKITSVSINDYTKNKEQLPLYVFDEQSGQYIYKKYLIEP
jgi:hypothetical protein